MMPSSLERYSKASTASSSVMATIFGSSDIVKVGVLRSDAGVVKTGGDGVNRSNLSVLILAEIGLHTVENA